MSQQWYYRKAGKQLGPVAEDDLRQIIKSGVLGQGDMVCSSPDTWMSVADSPLVEQVAHSSMDVDGTRKERSQAEGANMSKEVRSAIAESHRYLHQRDVRLAKQSEARPRRIISLQMPEWGWVWRWTAAVVSALFTVTAHLFQWIVKTAGPAIKSKRIGGGMAVVVINLLAIFSPASKLTHSQVHRFLDQSATELRRLRIVNANDAQWEAFSQRTRAELREMVPQLERTATTDAPESIEYLFLARDFLPRMLDDSRQQSSETEKKFDIHMDRVERVFRRATSWYDRVPRWPLVAVALLDSLLVAYGLWWWMDGR